MFMKSPIIALVGLMCLADCTAAQNYTYLAGTYSVEFYPIQVGGVVHGCTLEYKAMSLDHAYRHGKPVFVIGYIAYMSNFVGDTASLLLKVGTRPFLPEPDGNPMTPPYFAYIQTKDATTAKSEFSTDASELGYRTFRYQLDMSTAKVIVAITTGEPISLGFNREKNGLDTLVALDLNVEDSESVDGVIKPKRSTKTVDQFRACFGTVTRRFQR